MPKINRVVLAPFGAGGVGTDFGQFGSKQAGFPQTESDFVGVDAYMIGCQQLSAWTNGWKAAIASGDKAGYVQDMNGWCFVHSRLLAYVFQAGIPEWNNSTTYYVNSVAQSGGQWFVSLQDNNINNLPPAGASNAFWSWVNPPTPRDGGLTLNAIPRVASVGPVVLADGLLSDDGVNVIIGGAIGVNGIKFPDGTIQYTAAVGANAVTVQSPPAAYATTPSRAIGSTYQNTGSKPRFVAVSISAVNVLVNCYCDGSSTPATIVWSMKGGTDSSDMCATFFVLPGYYYKVIGGALSHWTEWT